MKILIEESVLRQALEAFELYYKTEDIPYSKCETTITALRSALDAAENVEPVAWMMETTHKESGEKRIWISTDRKGWTGMVSVEYGEQIPLYPHPAPAIPEGWQPIETAPKTGRTVLLGYFNSHGNWRTMRGQWFSQEVINETWEEPDDCDGLEGWYETSVEADDVPNCWATDPTHWMPLPAPPKLGADKTGEGS